MRIVPYVAGRLGVSDSEMSLPQGTVIARIEAGKEPILLEAGKLDMVVLTTTPDVLEVGLKLWADESWRDGFELVAREEFASGVVQETWQKRSLQT